MTESGPIKAVIFDAYGTLLDLTTIDRRLEFHFGDRAPGLAALWRRKQLEYTWLRTLMDDYRDFSEITADALVYACRQLQLQPKPSVLSDLIEHYYRLEIFPDVLEALPRLQPHFKLAILSNADTNLLEEAVKYNRIAPYLAAVLSVDAIRRFKPSPEVYRLPARELGLDSRRLLFVSTNAWDVCGAKAAGLRVAWLQRQPTAMEELGQQPDLIVNDLHELTKKIIA